MRVNAGVPGSGEQGSDLARGLANECPDKFIPWWPKCAEAKLPETAVNASQKSMLLVCDFVSALGEAGSPGAKQPLNS